jgi:hypothetical protein
MNINIPKNNFVKRVGKFFLKNINLKNKVYGISIAPICFYNNEPSITLGYERDGVFTSMYNYFGGKIEDKINDLYDDIDKTNSFRSHSLERRSQILAEVLFEETYEEFGIVLTPRYFKRCVLGVIEHPYSDGVSLIFPCHISEVSGRVWHNIIMNRFETYKFLPWNLQEMSKIDNVRLKDIDKLYEKNKLSTYVYASIDSVAPFYNLLTEKNEVSYDTFGDTRDYVIS